MRTLRRLMAVGLLIGSYYMGMAQSNSVPNFKTEAERTAWKEANPDHSAFQTGNKGIHTSGKVNSELREVRDPSGSGMDRKTWIEVNPQKTARSSGQATEVENRERFSSESEKQTWLEANPQERTARVSGPATQVQSKEKFSSDAEKEAWIQANPDEYRRMGGSLGTSESKAAPAAAGRTIDLSAQPTGAARTKAVRVNNTHNALPANYKPTVQETKTEK